MIGGTAITDVAKVREASEKDVMKVLDMVRTEFNVDERRIYLMGHSMGGAGTYYLGSKHGNVWAALAPIAPALPIRSAMPRAVPTVSGPTCADWAATGSCG